MKLLAIYMHKGLGYSIDSVDEQGNYISQEAFFFKDKADAEKRLDAIITEDGGLSQRFAGPLPLRWIS